MVLLPFLAAILLLPPSPSPKSTLAIWALPPQPTAAQVQPRHHHRPTRRLRTDISRLAIVTADQGEEEVHMVVINSPVLDLDLDLDQEAQRRPILLRGHPRFSRWNDLHLGKGTPVLKMWLQARACPVLCWQRVFRRLSSLDQEVPLRTSLRPPRFPLFLRLERMQLAATSITRPINTTATRAMGSVQEDSLLSVLEAIRKRHEKWLLCLHPTLRPVLHPDRHRVVLLLQHRPRPMF